MFTSSKKQWTFVLSLAFPFIFLQDNMLNEYRTCMHINTICTINTVNTKITQIKYDLRGLEHADTIELVRIIMHTSNVFRKQFQQMLNNCCLIHATSPYRIIHPI